ncbi:hypothetical protein SAMN04487866_11371 [Thermoactinomyces sp. DSM 45891]|uniref:hypothetical protein n=1 Tax=Thermoactinomyces sp. DSM 45891 TaxID=1761907 RepID=UPI00091412EA|nr:hypothetical protein [Thermoactinomyces sp. DSM 45891]SFX60584.1 hypothetical protein SAMN04487866_11371 [Thermoactinomyces sp. DSM 45891]
MNKWLIRISCVILAVALVACGNTKNDSSSKPADPHAGHKTEENKTGSQTHVEWSTTIDKPKSSGEINIKVKEHSGKAVPEFKVNHEKLLHLIIVSEDLSYFDHVHPEYKGNGEFTIQTQVPKAGKYKLIADYIPKDGAQTTQTYKFTVQGDVSKEDIQPDQKLVKVVDGKEIDLQISPEPKVNQQTMLTFQIKDATNKQGITDLQPYLGAVGHVVILSEDTEEYLHVHPMDEKSTGPEAKFHTKFPKSGIYKIWGQFQRDGKVFTVPFVVKVL